jgi:hypothetical protein
LGGGGDWKIEKKQTVSFVVRYNNNSWS